MPISVSVILPLHNAAEYLGAALQGLQAIARHDVEFIVVNDHSDDDTAQILKGWPTQITNLSILTAESKGVASARNQAVSAAKGEYLWFADCDDSWSHAVLQDLHDEALRTSADIVICNAAKVFSSGQTAGEIIDAATREEITGPEALERLLRGEIEGHLWNKLFRASLFARTKFPSTRAHSDLGAMFGLFAGATGVALVPSTLYTYVLHAGSILNRRAYRWEDLEDCLTLARAAHQQSGSNVAGSLAMLLFRYRNVVIPIENETVRRYRLESKSVISAVRRRNQKRISIADFRPLVQAGEAKLALRLGLLKILPGGYHLLYAAYRRRTRSGLDVMS